MKRLIVVAAAAGLSVAGLGSVSAAGAATAAPAAKLSWHGCSDSAVAYAANFDKPSLQVSKLMQCAELSVPLDWSHPGGTKITLELSRVEHTGSGAAKGDIVVNPGGPGGSGTGFGARVFAQNSAAMQAAYNVVGFDPRGVGDSKPAVTCDDHYNNAPRPYYGTGGAKDDKIWLARSAGYTADCKANDKIGLLNHIKTIDSDRDLNAIRVALGHNKLDYYGASYGSYLGSTYATLFPTHVGHMVLDGDVGPSGVWYDANLAQDVAFDNNIEYFFGWIAKYDGVYHLGTTQKAVHDFYYATQDKLAKHPVYSGDGTYAAGADDLSDGMGNAAYRRSQAVWNAYATGLAAYKSGDTATFLDTFAAPTKDPVDDNEFAVYNAVQCTDVQWPTDFKTWHRDNTKINAKHPFLTWNNVWFNAPCLTWPAKAGKPVDVGANPLTPKNILLFEATADAATPLAGALDLHSRLKGSHIVIQDGDRTHCIVHRGDPQVDAYYDAYFLDGTLPTQSETHVPQLGDPVPPAAAAATAKALTTTSAATGVQHDVIK